MRINFYICWGNRDKYFDWRLKTVKFNTKHSSICFQRGPDSLLKFKFLDFCYSKVPIFLQKSLSNWPVTLRKIIFFSSKYRVSQKNFYLGHPVLFWKIFLLIQLHYNKKCYWHNWKKILAAGCPIKKLFLTEYW